MSKQYFSLLFFVMILGLIFWAIVSTVNMTLFREVSLIWAAVVVFMWSRFLPVAGILHWEMYKEKDLPDGESENTLVTENVINHIQ